MFYHKGILFRVNSLSSDALLAEFRRFASRSGKPLHVYSDNGTNFVESNLEIRKLYDCLKADEFVTEKMSQGGV